MDFLKIVLSLLLCLCGFSLLNASNEIVKSLVILRPEESPVSRFINESFIVYCNGPDNTPLKWKDPNQKEVNLTKGPVHVENKTTSLALVFEQISEKDQGNWTCEATIDPSYFQNNPDFNGDAHENIKRGNAMSSKVVELLVHKKISLHTTQTEKSVSEGSDATISCFVKADESPIIVWVFNGVTISTSNSNKYKLLSDGLFIKNVTQADSGEYTCRAICLSNTYSDSAEIVIILRIEQKPVWLQNESKYYAYIGSVVNISCYAKSEPPASFTWTYKGSGLERPYYREYYPGNGSTLQIQVNKQEQFGDYKCKAKNKLGELERNFRLQMGKQPLTPTLFNIKRNFSDGFEFIIRSQELPNVDPTMRIFAYQVQHMRNDSLKFYSWKWEFANKTEFSFHGGKRFVLRGLAPNTTYLFRVAAKNLAGLSKFTDVHTFRTQANLASSTYNMITWKATAVIIFISIIVNKFMAISN